jgi:hypothetical protein
VENEDGEILWDSKPAKYSYAWGEEQAIPSQIYDWFDAELLKRGWAVAPQYGPPRGNWNRGKRETASYVRNDTLI